MDTQLQKLLDRRAPGGDRQHFVLPHETDYANIPQEPVNPLTAEKVALGKVLSGNCFPNNDPESRRDLGCK